MLAISFQELYQNPSSVCWVIHLTLPHSTHQYIHVPSLSDLYHLEFHSHKRTNVDIDEFGEWSGCIDFESGEETDAQVPELFYTKLQDVPPSTDEKSAQKNSIQLLNYRVVAFMSPDFLVVSSPDKWFETQEIIASAAGGTLTIVNYNLLKQAGPLKTIKRCQPQWQTPFSRAISASIANVCELDAGVAIMDPHYAAVYWEKVEPSMISTLIRKKACHAPWVIADPSAELSLEEENNVYVDNWLFLDAIVGRTTDLKESKK